MSAQEYYLPLRVHPCGDGHCNRTCKSLYSVVDDDQCNELGRLYFCTFCDHARVEETPAGDLLRLDYCKQFTTVLS